MARKAPKMGGRHSGSRGRYGMGHKGPGGMGRKIHGMGARMGKSGSTDIEGPHEKDMAQK